MPALAKTQDVGEASLMVCKVIVRPNKSHRIVAEQINQSCPLPKPIIFLGSIVVLGITSALAVRTRLFLLHLRYTFTYTCIVAYRPQRLGSDTPRRRRMSLGCSSAQRTQARFSAYRGFTDVDNNMLLQNNLSDIICEELQRADAS